MKKIFKTAGICLGLPLLNFFIVSFIQGFFLIYTQNNISLLYSNVYLLTILGNILTLILIGVIFLASNEGIIKRIKIKKIDLKEYIYIGVLSIGVSILLLFLSAVLTKIIPSYNQVINQLDMTRNSLLQLIIVILLIPIYEEVFYRGIIFGFLRKNFNIVIAIIVQALIFGFMHLNLVQGIYTFILGIILGLVYVYSDSILGNITVHIIFNLLGMLIIPKLTSVFPNMSIVLIIIGVICIIFASLHMIQNLKFNKCSYGKKIR